LVNEANLSLSQDLISLLTDEARQDGFGQRESINRNSREADNFAILTNLRRKGKERSHEERKEERGMKEGRELLILIAGREDVMQPKPQRWSFILLRLA